MSKQKDRAPCFFSFFESTLCGLSLKKNECAKKERRDGPLLAVGLSCVWSLMKDPFLHEKSSAVVEGEIERGKKAPPWLCWRSVQKRNGGRVKQADCLESNKTRRLRGPGSSFGSFDWFQRIGLGPTRRESFKLLIVGSPSPKISVYPKHISLRSWMWPQLLSLSRMAALWS